MTVLTAEHLFARNAQTRTEGDVEIVIPCYNEAARLDADAFIAALDAEPSLNLVFVNDGSADETLSVLSDLQARRPERIDLLSLARNSGKAEAVRQGLVHASKGRAAFVGYWDADLATPLDAIADFARVMRKFPEAQVVFGSRRMLLGHRIERTLKRRTVSRICGLLARQAIGLPVADTQCGAKLLRTGAALDAALSRPFTAGWLFDVELFARIAARTEGRRRAFYEQPLAEWYEIAGSKVDTRAIVRSGMQMLRLILAMRLGLEVAQANAPVPMVRVLPRTAAPVATAAPAAVAMAA